MKVSVLVATKDRPDRLAGAVEAVLAQDWPDLEVIVKDASSCPGPLPDDDRVFRVCGPDASICAGYNAAARFAAGDVMHNICDDDRMLPGTIRNAVEALDRHDAAWTYGKLRYRDEQLGKDMAQVALEPWNPATMMLENRVHQPTVFYRRHAWLELGPFDERWRYAYDYEFWGRLGARYPPVARDHFDAVYHFWPGSTSVATPELVHADATGIQAQWAEHGFGRRPGDP